MHLRLPALSRVFAAWLVVLIVLPFTAPWGVCDWSDFRHSSSSSDGLAKTPVSPDETLVPPSHYAPLPPLFTLVACQAVLRVDRILAAPAQYAVLRL
jgi:hypothetical protein